MFRDLEKEQEFNHELHCSRERSRAAREIIEKVVADYGIAISWNLLVNEHL